jgi:hypothetical protein
MTPKLPKKEPQKEGNGIPQMPFDDALRRLLASKPQHRAAKKKPAEKK